MKRTGRKEPKVITKAGNTERLTGGQAIVRYLQAQWSERDGHRRRLIPAMFGIFGHGNVCGLGQALDEDGGAGLPFYQPKNEQAMVHTAIGYAKATQRLATLACTASIGPGSTNMVTGAATATVNRIPVLLFPSDTFANRLQGPPMQSLDSPHAGDLTVNDCFRPVSVYFDRISRPEQLLSALPAAMQALTDPAKAGAVTISLHQDVQAEAYDYPASFFDERVWMVRRPRPGHEEIVAAVERIRSGSRPLIIGGGGVHYSGAEVDVAGFSEAFGIPVAETSAGKGAGSLSPLSVGAIGHSGTRAANALARDADVVISVGSRLIDLTTGSNTLFRSRDIAFVGVNLAASDAAKLGALSVVGDAKRSIEELANGLKAANWGADPDWRARVAEETRAWKEDLSQDLEERSDERMSQGQVLRALNQAAGPKDALVVASGTPHVDIHKLWDSSVGTRVFMEVGFSCMGHEIPAALGVRMARPELEEVFVVIGDGTYLMAPSELVTAVQERLKITVLVLVNGGYQSIHALQRGRTGRSFGLEFRARRNGSLGGDLVEVDFAANARSFGCTAFTAETLDQVRSALSAAREEEGPTVIAARVEPHRLLLDSQCWWDVGVAEVSEDPATQQAFSEHARGRQDQRFYY